MIIFNKVINLLNEKYSLQITKDYAEKTPIKDDDIVKIDEKIVNEIEKNVGFDKNYVINCLKKNVINYATSTYYLLARENSNNDDNNIYENNIDFYS